MNQQVPIDLTHFIGEGKKAWLIVGRLPNDDEDTVSLVLGDDEGQAQETFKAQVIADHELSEADLEEIEHECGTRVVVLSSQILN